MFFLDPLEAQPHDVDVKALLRLAAVWNMPLACNRASADFMFSSPLMTEEYERFLPAYDAYRERMAEKEASLVAQPNPSGWGAALPAAT